MNTTDFYDFLPDLFPDSPGSPGSPGSSGSADCGYGCKNMLAVMDRLTAHMCESKETTTRMVVITTLVILIQLMMLIGCVVSIGCMRHSHLSRQCRHCRSFCQRDDAKKQLVHKSEEVVAEMDDAEL